MMPDNEAEIVETMAKAIAVVRWHDGGDMKWVRDESTFLALARAALAASPIERLQARIAQLERALEEVLEETRAQGSERAAFIAERALSRDGVAS